MSATLQFLFTQAPLFWTFLAAFFFGVGLFWAHTKWYRYRTLVDLAAEEQLVLVDKRDEALAAQASTIHDRDVPEPPKADRLKSTKPKKKTLSPRSLDRKVKGIFEKL